MESTSSSVGEVRTSPQAPRHSIAVLFGGFRGPWCWEVQSSPQAPRHNIAELFEGFRAPDVDMCNPLGRLFISDLCMNYKMEIWSEMQWPSDKISLALFKNKYSKLLILHFFYQETENIWLIIKGVCFLINVFWIKILRLKKNLNLIKS